MTVVNSDLSLKERIYEECPVSVLEIIEGEAISTHSGISSLDCTFSLFLSLYAAHTDSVDEEKFNAENDLRIETKYENIVDMEWVETIKVAYLNNKPFMILSQKGDDSVMETVIDYELFNSFIDALRNCLTLSKKLTENELNQNDKFTFS
jgi:hypothetical protein